MPPRRSGGGGASRSGGGASRASAPRVSASRASAPRAASAASRATASRPSASSQAATRKAPTVHQKEHIWNSASTVRGKDPNLYRRDVKGNVMYKPSYGKTSAMAWEADHKKPLAKGGTNHTRNFQALNTTENRKKGANY
eukprot:CAMPEP_0194588456 /NCGR_PEP_ID=MMETSP0292-20121207/19794_1 /TAXON_ID=39354 /ORGANISM="Heterosigma akashiwo, Strain CCMP2393" /LENGTH=139 /DNA_ID=CAMNT_0039444969 /DNA_START=8 /DNA_END=427 /DNA_ORIENTATION=+